MSYVTIESLPEKLKEALIGSEYLLLTTPDTSFKVTLNTISDGISLILQDQVSTLTNKVIDDISNYVHANAVHYSAVAATQDILKGTPVTLVQNASDSIYVDIAIGANKVIGFAGEDVLAGATGKFIFFGMLSDYDTSAWSEGDLIYFQNGALVNTLDTLFPSQSIGYVVNTSATVGQILITNLSSIFYANDIEYDNTTGTLNSTNVKDALDELSDRKPVLSGSINITGDLAYLPSIGIGEVIGGIANVYITPGVITEYTCSMGPDGDRILFDPADNLNGYTCEVTYFTK